MESVSEIEFLEVTKKADVFFEILPPDWQESIVPYWSDYQNSSRIFVLKKHAKVLGGGIVFSKVSPDTLFYEDIAKGWFHKGYLYIAFLFIAESERGQGLGSLWLKELFKQMPKQSFWLSIEEYGLHKFYEENGFVIDSEIGGEYGQEWIMTRKA